MSLSSYVWDLSNPNVPNAELLAPSQLVTAKFNVKDDNLVGAGQYNGQFTCFDTRKGSSPVDSTPMDVCHRWVAWPYFAVVTEAGGRLCGGQRAWTCTACPRCGC
eukprot:GHRQ01034764.1.p1 GENE.GHRQ01034764.1~~GHRQ01034764.1.p1  ORF type:complete len:105 (+),score=14.41 GHRQ01034764.1:303-617(+)